MSELHDLNAPIWNLWYLGGGLRTEANWCFAHGECKTWDEAEQFRLSTAHPERYEVRATPPATRREEAEDPRG